MDEATKQRIAERIAERKKLGLSADQFDAHARQQITDAARTMQLQVARSFTSTYYAVRCQDDAVAAATHRRNADGAMNAAASAEAQRVAAVEYAKKFGAIVRK